MQVNIESDDNVKYISKDQDVATKNVAPEEMDLNKTDPSLHYQILAGFMLVSV